MRLNDKLQLFLAVSVLQMFVLANPGPLHAQKLPVANTAFAGTFTIVSRVGLNSIIDFRAEGSAEVKKFALDKMFDHSLLQEIQKEQAVAKQEWFS